MSPATESEPSGVATGESAESLGRAIGVDVEIARRLVTAGFYTAEQVRSASDSELHDAGLSEETISQLRSVGPPASGEDPAVAKWITSARKTDRGRRRPHSGAKASADVLRRWVGGDDRAIESWIQQSEEAAPAAEPAPREAHTEVAVPASVAPAAEVIPARIREREETVVRWLTELLDRVKSDSFDPGSIVQELQELERELFDERERRRMLDEQLEQVKRGSVAVIKYVRQREAAAREALVHEKDKELAELQKKVEELVARMSGATGGGSSEAVAAVESRLRAEFTHREEELLGREAELRRQVVRLEGELRTAHSEAEVRKPVADGMPSVDEREREIVRRENELRSRFEEIRIRAEEIERKREPLAYKEREIATRESELSLQQKTLEAEARRLEELRRSGLPTGAGSGAGEGRAKDLLEELRIREEDLRNREQFLAQRAQELDLAEGEAASRQADAMHADAVESVAGAGMKVRTGVRRLDDLLFGGLPKGSQVLVNGPAHTGKDVLSRLFIMEGLRHGEGALLLVTDRTYQQMREDLTALYPGFTDLEQKGFVRYIDLYSRSLGVTEAEKSVKLLSSTDKGLLEQLPQAVGQLATELKEKAGTYRILFESVSTITAYLDSMQAFRFLQPLVGRRKMDGATGYYEIETGMHSDSDLQTLEHMVDGSIHLKVDQLKTFLSVRGITDVQSRAWVGYTFSKKSFSLGSFSLDHIR